MEQKVVQKAPEQAKKSKPNLTGIPTQMKLDFEQRSGLSFDDVWVHYNSDKPRRIGALAYTQIPQVHIGPGQERHLRHELGHVVQQKMGIVRPSTYINGLPVNVEQSLEQRADIGFSSATPLMYYNNCVVQMKKVSEFTLEEIRDFLPDYPTDLLTQFLEKMGDIDISAGDEKIEIIRHFHNYLMSLRRYPAVKVVRMSETLRYRNRPLVDSTRLSVCEPVAHDKGYDPYANRETTAIPSNEKWFQLGFHSVALFEHSRTDDKHFLVKQFYVVDATYRRRQIELPCDTPFTAIFTRAVSTCQVIAAYDPSSHYILVAHLDARDHIPIDLIRAFCSRIGITFNFVSAFVSRIEQSDEIAKIAELEKEFGSQVGSKKEIPFKTVLSREDPTHAVLHQHPWIGVDSKNLKIMGYQGVSPSYSVQQFIYLLTGVDFSEAVNRLRSHGVDPEIFKAILQHVLFTSKAYAYASKSTVDAKTLWENFQSDSSLLQKVAERILNYYGVYNLEELGVSLYPFDSLK